MPIIDISFPLHEGELPPGQYSFPFSFTLPDWLPASMACGILWERARAGIEYRLVAQFLPKYQQHWCDDRRILSSFNTQTPLYVMRPQL